jgi:hypothetical protein
MSDTMTIAEVNNAFIRHFGGNLGTATLGLISFLQEQDDDGESAVYKTAVVQEWLDR